MTDADRKPFVMALTGTFELYGKELSELMLESWWRLMCGYDLRAVLSGLDAHARDPEAGRYPPKPADVIRHMDGSVDDQAECAWRRVTLAMQTVGAYADVDFADAAVHAAVMTMGGWPTLCRKDVRELSFMHRDFAAAYTAHKRFGAACDAPRVLAGDRSPDWEYQRRGLKAPEPVRIGAAMSPAATALISDGSKRWAS